jgi:hypothetical protein
MTAKASSTIQAGSSASSLPNTLAPSPPRRVRLAGLVVKMTRDKNMTVYQKIKRIAVPIVKAYQTDITIHDRKSCAAMKPGETALWSCRSHGSHFVGLAKSTDTVSRDTVESLRKALNYFDAVAKVFGNQDGSDIWYFIERTGEAVWPLTATEARQHFVNRIDHFMAAIHA